MSHALLDRRPHRPESGQPFLGDLRLARGRVHELCGGARHTLALLIAREMTGPVFWVRARWDGAGLYGPGMVRFIDPGRVTFIEAMRAQDVLWTLEEVLRAGVVPLVVGEMPGPPGLTPMRRMQLAAETGGGRALGLVLTPEGRAQGAESRWHMGHDHRKAEGWYLTRERDRHAPPRTWSVTGTETGFGLGEVKKDGN